MMKRLAFTLASAALAGCVGPACDNEVIAEMRSPDGRHVATVFDRGCGATVSAIRVVALRDAASAFDGERDEGWVFVVKEWVPVEVHWEADGQLGVYYEASPKAWATHERWNDVNVKFRHR